MRGVALDDLIIQCRPVLETVCLGRSDVSDNPDTLARIFGKLELGYQPGQLAVRIMVTCGGIKVEVHGVAKVGIKGDNAESGGGGNSVSTVVRLDGRECRGGEPAGPGGCEAVVEP
jgi:hypothetical protein